ncbi:MAG: HAD hydrolase-like protein [Bacteroidia bacterium]|nr:HAD hydrolase-like protein [Bacteroidia bacterium]
MKKKLLIFDFDGTIADTPQVALQIYNDLSGDYGLPIIDRKDFGIYRQKSVSELLDMAGLSWFRMPSLVRKARQGFTRYIQDVVPIPGIPEFLHQLIADGYTIGILTSNTRENVRVFLQKHELEVFEFIHAPRSLFGKAPVIRRLLRQYRISPGDALMIGDELRDIEAARKSGIDSVAVTWGFNTEELLRGGSPTHVADTPAALYALLQRLADA